MRTNNIIMLTINISTSQNVQLAEGSINLPQTKQHMKLPNQASHRSPSIQKFQHDWVSDIQSITQLYGRLCNNNTAMSGVRSKMHVWCVLSLQLRYIAGIRIVEAHLERINHVIQSLAHATNVRMGPKGPEAYREALKTQMCWVYGVCLNHACPHLCGKGWRWQNECIGLLIHRFSYCNCLRHAWVCYIHCNCLRHAWVCYIHVYICTMYITYIHPRLY